MFYGNIFDYMNHYRRCQKDMMKWSQITPKEYGIALQGKRKKKKGGDQYGD